MKHLQPHSVRGFTLLELLVVLLILGILATLIVPQFFGHVDDAYLTKEKFQINQFSSALSIYKLNNNQLPTTEQGLKALVEKPTLEPIPKNWLPQGYLGRKTIPVDSWDRKYEYKTPGERGVEFDVYSRGKNKDSPDDDIGNW